MEIRVTTACFQIQEPCTKRDQSPAYPLLYFCSSQGPNDFQGPHLPLQVGTVYSFLHTGLQPGRNHSYLPPGNALVEHMRNFTSAYVSVTPRT
jgi:hypothetical protein